MDPIIGVLKRIKKHPGVYIEEPSVKRLYVFLGGYTICLYDLENRMSIMSGFQRFVERKFKVNISKNWGDIIYFYSSSDEKGFEKFYKLMDEYLESIGMSWSEEGNEKNQVK